MSTLDFDSLYKKGIEGGDYNGRAPSIRASGVPFCPRKFLFSYTAYLDSGSYWDAKGDFFCDIGTAVHNVIQKWVPKYSPGYFVGNWECYGPRCINRVFEGGNGKIPKYHEEPFVVEAVAGPIPCPKCGKMMSYGELKLNFPDAPMTGHTDGLLIDRDFAAKTYGVKSVQALNKLIKKKLKTKIPAWVLELKSTGKWNLPKIRKSGEPVYTQHKAQATIYTSALRKIAPTGLNLNGIDIKGYIFKYIARDHPNSVSIDIVKEVETDKLYNNTCKMVNMLHASFKGKLGEVYKLFPCKKWPFLYEDCEWTEMCFPLSKVDFKEMVFRVGKAYRDGEGDQWG
jgi:hypothetical protein